MTLNLHYSLLRYVQHCVAVACGNYTPYPVFDTILFSTPDRERIAQVQDYLVLETTLGETNVWQPVTTTTRLYTKSTVGNPALWLREQATHLQMIFLAQRQQEQYRYIPIYDIAGMAQAELVTYHATHRIPTTFTSLLQADVATLPLYHNACGEQVGLQVTSFGQMTTPAGTPLMISWTTTLHYHERRHAA